MPSYATERGWTVVDTYSDAAISGASRFRPAFQKLLTDAVRRQLEAVICEAVDRLGRRLADTADLQDRLAFNGVKLFTPTLGEITQIHVPVMGMMAQMAIKDLGEKTRRGQLGRVLKGMSAGGLAYGYRVPATREQAGEREIDPDEAQVVRRIFQEYAAGDSPELIARRLNREGMPGPGGRSWSNTTIRGQNARGTGVLNNALYQGVLEWNRCSYVKDPQTGRRIARPNPPTSWERQDAPHLRIIEDALWQATKARQAAFRDVIEGKPTSTGANSLNDTHRARFLLSGLMRCGCCGGGYTIIGKDRYGCATRKQKGTCDNGQTIIRQEIEARVLDGLKERLLAPELIAEFVAAFKEEIEGLRREKHATTANWARKSGEIDRKIAGILRAIEDGLYEPALKARLKDLQAERDSLSVNDGEATEAEVTILSHPSLPDLYRRKVEQLEAVLDSEDRTEAMEIIRSMIECVELHPRLEGKGLDAVLHGDLAAILAACGGAKTKNAPKISLAGRQLSMVAGTRNRGRLTCMI